MFVAVCEEWTEMCTCIGTCPVSIPSTPSRPVIELSTTDLSEACVISDSINLPVRTDLPQEWYEVGEEDIVGVGAGRIIVRIGALAIDQCEISLRNA